MNPPVAGTLIASWVEHDDRARDMLASLDEDQLRSVVVESLTVLDGFVHRLADHHAVSTRAVLRSMGIDPRSLSGESDHGRVRSPRGGTTPRSR